MQHFMTYEFIYEFMYMKNIVKSYLNSGVSRFQMSVVGDRRASWEMGSVWQTTPTPGKDRSGRLTRLSGPPLPILLNRSMNPSSPAVSAPLHHSLLPSLCLSEPLPRTHQSPDIARAREYSHTATRESSGLADFGLDVHTRPHPDRRAGRAGRADVSGPNGPALPSLFA